MFRAIGLFLNALFFVMLASAQTQPPIEAYGELPKIRYAAMSDSGRKVVVSMYKDEIPMVVVYDLDGGKPIASRTDGVQIRGVDFIGDEYSIVKASKATNTFGYRGKFEYSAAFSHNLKTNKIKQLLRNTEGLHPAQSGLGQILAQSSDKKHVFMPAYMGLTDSAQRSLLKVNLETGRGKVINKGNQATIDWIVNPDEVVLAREDYSDRRDLYRIYKYTGNDRELIYEEKNAPRPPFSLLGVRPDQEALILVNRGPKGGFEQLREMSFGGSISDAIMSRSDRDIDIVYSDTNRVIHGVRYSGDVPSYEFFDEGLNKDLNDLVSSMPLTAVKLIDWSEDWRYLLLKYEGQISSGVYIHYDRETKKSLSVGQVRPDIPRDAIGEILPIKYPARDGLQIPAIITLPPGIEIATMDKLPLIVMPHGGPESYDSVRFDWMAQYFANRGYLVLQPNFRGSAGYGTDFIEAGDGQWGGKMQDDITDGVRALISDGMADPDRICIVGASYGGYAALAGGAFTPDLYKCVAAVAPVSDLPRMLASEKRDHGSHHWVVNYWEERMADGTVYRDKLKAISPVHHAAAFQVPVLLIHGKDDTVVPIKQSEVMRSALKRANKDVDLIKIKGEDHWLSDSPSRLATLKAMSAFVEDHIGE